jgi:lysozyme family protein
VSIDAFNKAFTDTVGLEGKFSIEDSDPGNWTGGKVGAGKLVGTAWGISAAAYPTEDIAALAGNPQRAKSIYLRDYWDKMHCDALPDPVGIALFKEGVNMGVAGAVRAMQRSLRQNPDGVMGQVTEGVIHATDPKEVVQGFLTECAYDYTSMDNFKIDGKGWLSRVIQTAVEASF